MAQSSGGSTPAEEGAWAVAAKRDNLLQITALNRPAELLGLTIGAPLATARAICPSLRVFDADEPADLKTLHAIADWCDRFTPLVALDPPHGLLLDITGCVHLFGGEAALLETLSASLKRQGFVARGAIAGTAVCARALTRRRHGDVVKPGGESVAIAGLPVTALEADPKIVQALRRAGLKTIGDVAARARAELAQRFGSAFTALLDQAVGQDDAPISPRKPVPDFVAEKRFAEPVATTDVIGSTLQSLAQVLIEAMDRQGKGARQLAVSLFRTDGAVRSLVIDAGHPVTRTETVARLFAEKIDALNDPIDPGFGFDLIRLCATQTVDVAPAQRGFDTHAHEVADVTELADRLAARLGSRRVLRYVPQETHIPERAALAVPLIHVPFSSSDAVWPTRIEGEPPLRPLRLLQNPEAIDVIAMFPDGPPAQFEWRRMRHRIVHVEGPERIAMEWWRSSVEYDEFTRDYFRIESQDGRRFWIYRHGIHLREVRSFGWFMQAIFA